MAKQQAPMVSSDDVDSIIDLTEIVQKGKPPLASKPDVDFDSALSDLMGKTPAVKLDETPELEALLSGIDEDASNRKPAAREYDEPEKDADEPKALLDADDMDSLLTSLTGKSNKNVQPAEEDVDSLLDSLMDDLNPPDTSSGTGDQDISDDDLDDLLSSIEQDSRQAPKAQAPKAPADLDDLLAGLNAPAAPVAPVAPVAPKAAAPKSSDDLDDLLAGLDFAPDPAPKVVTSEMDDLVAGLKSPAPAPKPEPNPVDSIDDLLAGLDNLAKPAAEATATASPAAAAAPSAQGTSEASLDDLLAGLDGVARPAANTPKPKAAAEDDRIDFGDLASLLDSPKAEKADALEELDEFDTAGAPDNFDKPSFNAKDFDDLDVLFVNKSAEKQPATPKTSAQAAAPVVQPEIPHEVLELATRLPEFTARLDKVENQFTTLQERVALLESRPEPEPQPDLAALLADGSPLCDRLMELVRSALSQELHTLSARVDSTAQAVTALQNGAVSTESKLAEVAIVAAKALAGPEQPEALPSVSAADLEPLTARLNALEATAIRQEELDVQSERLDVLEAAQQTAQTLGHDAIAARLDALEALVIQQEAQAMPFMRTSASTPDTLHIPDISGIDGSSATSAEPPAAQLAAEELAKLDHRLAVLESRPYVPLETIQGAFDQMGEQLNTPLQQFQNRLALLEQRLTDDALPQLAGDLLPFMSASIDKAAAASAARALREELEALMTETSDDGETNDESTGEK